MNKESIRNCYNSTLDYLNEEFKKLYFIGALIDIDRLTFDKSDPFKTYFKNDKYNTKFREATCSLSFYHSRIFAYKLIKESIAVDFNAKSTTINIDIEDTTLQFEMVEFESFFLILTDPILIDDLLEKYKINEKELHDEIYNQYDSLHDKGLLILLFEPFFDSMFFYNLNNEYIMQSYNKEMVVNINDLIDILYEEYRQESIKTLITKYNKEMFDKCISMLTFTYSYSINKEDYCDFLLSDVVTNPYVNECVLNLSYISKKTGRLINYGNYQLLLTESEKNYIKQFFMKNLECLDDVASGFDDFISSHVNPGNDYSPKALPLLKMVEKTFQYLLSTFWSNGKHDDVDYGDDQLMQILPIEKYIKSLYTKSPALVTQFNNHKVRYEELKKVADAWIHKWRNGFVHKERMTSGELLDAFVGSIYFLSLLILVYSK